MRIGLAATGRPLKLVERQLMAHRDATVPFDAIGRTADVQPGVRPSDWTVSCGDFDSLPGVVILELRRA